MILLPIKVPKKFMLKTYIIDQMLQNNVKTTKQISMNEITELYIRLELNTISVTIYTTKGAIQTVKILHFTKSNDLRL